MTDDVSGRIGMRLRRKIERPDVAVVRQLAEFGSNLVADGMNRFNVIVGAARSLCRGWKLAGPATTVRVRPADNLMVMRAIDVAEPGDVLVVSTGRTVGNAVWGKLMTLAAMKRGLAGVVTDGGVRDLPILERLGFPVFGGGLTPAACDKDGPGEINFPVAIGDVPILPGDIVVADDDGVAIVPRGDVADVIVGIEAKRQSEEKRRRDIAAGLVVPAAVVAAVDAKLA